MAYTPPWEKLSEALARVINASGAAPSEAKALLCRAIEDRAVRVQGKPRKHNPRGTTVKDVILEGKDLSVPTSLKPEDLDWHTSRPIKEWLVPPGASVRNGYWDFEWIKVCTADVSEVLRQSTAGGKSAAHQASRKPAPTSKSRPAYDGARRAVLAVYPNGIPSQAAERNKILCARIADWLKKNRLPNVSNETILRAAGRSNYRR